MGPKELDDQCFAEALARLKESQACRPEDYRLAARWVADRKMMPANPDIKYYKTVEEAYRRLCEVFHGKA